MKNDHGCKIEEPGHYTCHRVNGPMKIDGLLEGAAWQKAPKSPRFVDMVTGVPGFFDTRMAALWDENYLYVGFWIEEPNVSARITQRDDFVYNENDVEVFIDGGDCYYEFQVNALGTIYEVFYIWQEAYRPGGRFDIPEFDLKRRDVDVLGGFQDISRHKKHPRGRRWAFMDWDMPGLKTAVHVEGTLNDPATVDKGWRAQIAFPWPGMKHLAAGRSLPPGEGDVWRMDFSRFELLEYNGVKADPHPGWAFNKHGVYDSHIPECFTYVHFTRQPVL